MEQRAILLVNHFQLGGLMNIYGLSILEIRALIERALLPDHCRFVETSDGRFSITVTSANHESCQISVRGIAFDELRSSRAIVELIGEARYLLALKIQASLARSGSSDLPLSTPELKRRYR